MLSLEHSIPDLLLQWNSGSPIIFSINFFNDVFMLVSVSLKNTDCWGMFMFSFVRPCSDGRSICSVSALHPCGSAHSPSRLMHRQLPEPVPQVPWAQGWSGSYITWLPGHCVFSWRGMLLLGGAEGSAPVGSANIHSFTKPLEIPAFSKLALLWRN